MRMAVCGVGLVLAAALSEQAPKPAERRAGQKETRTDAVVDGSSSAVLSASAGEASECTRRFLQHERWAIVHSKSGQLRAFRYVSVEELESIAEGPRKGETRWSRARVDLFVTIAGMDGSSTLVELRARILAEVETPEAAMRPTNLVPLASTGALEGELIASLKARCRDKAMPSR